MHDSDNMNKEQELSQLMDGEWHDLDSAECVAAICGDETLRNKWARYHIIRDCLSKESAMSDYGKADYARDQGLVSRISAAIDDEPTYSNVRPLNAATSSAATNSVAKSTADTDDDTARSSDHNAIDHDSAPNAEERRSAPAPDLNLNGTRAVRKPSWLSTGLAGFALAASVALVTVVGVNVFEQQAPSTDPVTVATTYTLEPSATTVDAVSQANLPEVELVANTGSNTGSYWVSPESAQRVAGEVRLNMMLSQHIENSPTSMREGLLPYSRLVGYEEVSRGQ